MNRLIKWISVIAFIAIAFCIATASADSYGTCGKSLIWELDDYGLLRISGTGEMYNYANTYYSGYQHPWDNSISAVIIENGVTSIGSNAFYNCSKLTSITIPDSVISIGAGVFDSCSSLKSIKIPNSITSIGDDAFSYCSNLTSITIPNSVTYIGRSAFYNCSSLINITISNSMTSICYGTFNSCSSLTNITIPDSVTSIESHAFYNCSGLTNINIPNSVTSIETHAFYNCNSLTSIIIPDRVTCIDALVFCNCSSLKNITIPDNVISIGNSAFAGCNSLTSISIPNKVTSIGSSAFSRCSNLISITIPDSVTSIESNTFYQCNSLTTITIPDNLTSISELAFNDCPAIRYATIGSNGAKALSKAGYSFRVLGNTCDLQYSFSGSGSIIGLFVVSADATATELTIPDQVTNIVVYALSGCSNLKSITINTNLNELNFASLFEYNNKLESITIPADHPAYCSKDGVVFSKDEKQLIYCPNGKPGNYEIPSHITSINKAVFTNCIALTSITIPSSVISIDDKAFNNCISLKKATVEARMSTIPFVSMFTGCNALENIVIPADHHVYQSKDGIVFTNSNALVYCPRGKSGIYNIPDGTDKISTNSFSGCSLLTDITIPGSVRLLEGSAFSNCTDLTNITISGSIWESAFSGCSSLRNVKIQNSVDSIGRDAFSGCIALASIKLTEYIRSIGDNAFEKTTLIIAPENSYAAQWAYEHYYEYQLFKPERTIKITNDGNGTGVADPESGTEGTEVTLTAIPNEGYQFNEWIVISGGITIINNRFTIGTSEIEIRATFKAIETPTPTPTPAPTIGDTFSADRLSYRILTKNTVSFIGLDKSRDKAAVTNVSIPATVKYGGKTYKVTEIAAKALFKETKIKTVSIGKYVKTIGKSAFQNCTKLATVKGGAAVVAIGDSAFSGCKVLKTFPTLSKLQTVGANAFKGCVKLAKFTLGAKVKSIGKNAFNGCKALKNIDVKTAKLTDKNVGAAAFKGIYKKAVFKCPKKKLKAYKELFIKKGAPKTCTFE